MDHQVSYNAYQRSLYSDTPSTIAAAIAHPTPHPPIPQFINDAHTLPHGLSPGLPVTNDENNIYNLVIDLLDPDTREAALVELSKKREQYDDLALVLWHAFGQSSNHDLSRTFRLTARTRYHASPPPRDCLRLSNALPAEPDSTCV